MIFSKQIISPINTTEEYISAQLSLMQSKNATIINGSTCKFFIQNFTDEEINKFKMYWDIIKPMFKLDMITCSEYLLRWQGRPGTELYEFEFDSVTGHRITFGFYPKIKEFDLYFYEYKEQPTHTHFIMGKIQNLTSSSRAKDIVQLFHS